MSYVETAFSMIGLVVFFGACGTSFAFGVAYVWRKMKWAPVNINVTVNQHKD